MQPPLPLRPLSSTRSSKKAAAVNSTVALLKSAGGAKVATSLMLYCQDGIEADGSFKEGQNTGCDSMTPQLQAMGVGVERIVGSPSIANLRAAFKSPDGSIAAMVALAKKHKLRGIRCAQASFNYPYFPLFLKWGQLKAWAHLGY